MKLVTAMVAGAGALVVLGYLMGPKDDLAVGSEVVVPSNLVTEAAGLPLITVPFASFVVRVDELFSDTVRGQVVGLLLPDGSVQRMLPVGRVTARRQDVKRLTKT